MRIAVHDFGGYSFPAQLSQELAGRGHDVTHLCCDSLPDGRRLPTHYGQSPTGPTLERIVLPESFAKYSARKRFLHEREYAKRLIERVRAFSPDVVVSANAPLLSQRLLLAECTRRPTPFVFWQQDIASIAIDRLVRQRLPVVGSVVGRAAMRVERTLLRRSDAVICIADDFKRVLRDWGLDEAKVAVVENWAPLPELPTRPRLNPWAVEQGLTDNRVLLYSGALGLKHNPDLLLLLGQHVADRDDVRVVVVSEGPGASWLAREVEKRALDNVRVVDFQPYDRLADVLATAEVLVALLEPHAGVFSVPSKVLSYHCAGRPILAALPPANLAARTIERAASGRVVDPNDRSGFVRAADELLADDGLRARLGENARRFAEHAFDIVRIGDAFEDILARAAARGRTDSR